MGIGDVRRAVFLDRDGVINRNILNCDTGEYESPHRPEDLHIVPGALEAMAALQAAGFGLFLVSNQPSFAKGKTSLEAIKAIHNRLENHLSGAGIVFDAFYYCYHHPQGIVPGFSGACDCRKPSPFFLRKAAEDFNIDLGSSWMVGDRATDIACGKSAGARTIRIREDHVTRQEPHEPHEPVAEFEAADLTKAVQIILQPRRG